MKLSPIRNHYNLQISLLRLERQLAETEAALRQAKFDLREARQAQILYEGSFRAFRDKLTGKKEETETNLRHAVQKAETDLASAQRQKEQFHVQLPELKEKLADLPAWESLNDGSPEWHRLEGLYCIEAMHPLLELTHELLVERRNQFNGTYAGQVRIWQDLAEIYSAPEAAGEACRLYLLRLKAALEALDIPFDLPGFFDAPTAFLSAATKFTQMDRVNAAIAQTEKMQRLLPGLLQQPEA